MGSKTMISARDKIQSLQLSMLQDYLEIKMSARYGEQWINEIIALCEYKVNKKDQRLHTYVKVVNDKRSKGAVMITKKSFDITLLYALLRYDFLKDCSADPSDTQVFSNYIINIKNNKNELASHISDLDDSFYIDKLERESLLNLRNFILYLDRLGWASGAKNQQDYIEKYKGKLKKFDEELNGSSPLQQNESENLFCPVCGAKLSSESKFCSKCGSAINFDRYISPYDHESEEKMANTDLTIKEDEGEIVRKGDLPILPPLSIESPQIMEDDEESYAIYNRNPRELSTEASANEGGDTDNDFHKETELPGTMNHSGTTEFGLSQADDSSDCEELSNIIDAQDHNPSTQEWYFYKGADKQGPYSYAQMSDFVRKEIIQRETLVWVKGTPEWVPAAKTALAQELVNVVPDVPVGIISDKWLWALGGGSFTIGCAVFLILAAMGWNAGWAMGVIVLAANFTFLMNDIEEVKKTGRNMGSWSYLGCVLVPVYLFVRAKKTNRNYIPLVVWFVVGIIALPLVNSFSVQQVSQGQEGPLNEAGIREIATKWESTGEKERKDLCQLEKLPYYNMLKTPFKDEREATAKRLLQTEIHVANLKISNIKQDDEFASAQVSYSGTNNKPINERWHFRKIGGKWTFDPFGIKKAYSVQISGYDASQFELAANIGYTYDNDPVLILDLRSKSTAAFSLGWVNNPAFILITDEGNYPTKINDRGSHKFDFDPIRLQLKFHDVRGTIEKLRITDIRPLNENGLPNHREGIIDLTVDLKIIDPKI